MDDEISSNEQPEWVKVINEVLAKRQKNKKR